MTILNVLYLHTVYHRLWLLCKDNYKPFILPFQRAELICRDTSQAMPVEQFFITEESFHHSIVVTITLSAH